MIDMKILYSHIIKCIAIISLFCLMGLQGKASHFVGGDISYKSLGGGNYQITFKYYRDCNGIPMCNCPGLTGCSLYFPTISSADPGCSNFPTNISMSIVQGGASGYDVVQLCRSQTSVCSNCGTRTPGSFYPGVEVYTFIGTINLNSISPSTCCNVNIAYSECCRNAAITNLQNPSGSSVFVSCTINRCVTTSNSSPIFTSNPAVVINSDQAFTYNLGAIDPDGDSLSYSFASSMEGFGTPAQYKIPYNYSTYPFPYVGAPNANNPAPLGLHIDSITGDIAFTPTGNFVSNFVVEVKEWRYQANGTPYVVGITRRDNQFYSKVSGPANSPPKIITYNANGVLINSGDTLIPSNIVPPNYVPKSNWNICATKPICFYIEAQDDTASTDSTDLLWNAPSTITDTSKGSYSFTPDYSRTVYANSNEHIGVIKYDRWKFCWTPKASAYNNRKPYYFVVNANDRVCPVPARTYQTFAITVNQTPDAVISVDSSRCNFYRLKYTQTAATASIPINHNQTIWTVETSPGSGQFVQLSPDANNNFKLSRNFNTSGNYKVYLKLSSTASNTCSNDSISYQLNIPSNVSVIAPVANNCYGRPVKLTARGQAGVANQNKFEYFQLVNGNYVSIRANSLDSTIVISPPISSNPINASYKVTITEPVKNCTSSALFTFTDVIAIAKDSNISISVSPSSTQCLKGNSFALSNVSNLNVSTQYYWKTEDGSVLKDSAGIIKSYNSLGENKITLLAIKDTNTCYTDSNYVVLNTIPNPDASTSLSGNVYVCIGDSTLIKPATLDSNNTYVWYYKNGNQTRVAYPSNQTQVYMKQAGNYYLWVQNKTTLCQDSSVAISYIPSVKVPSVITPSKSGTLCNNETINLSGPSSTLCQWFKNNSFYSTNTNIGVNQAANYKLVTGSGYCTDTAYYNLTNTIFKISSNAQATEYKCLKDSMLVYPMNADTSNNYVWYYKSTSLPRVAYPQNQTNIYMNAIGTYTLWAQNKSSQCVDSLAVNFVGPNKTYSVITPSKTGVLCNNESITLNGPANTNYQWFKNNALLSTSRTIISNQVANYKLVVGSGVCYDTSVFTPVYSSVNISNNGNLNFYNYCPKTSVLAKIKSIANAQSYTWYLNNNLLKTGMDTFISLVAPTSTLKVVASNTDNCKDSLNISLQTLPAVAANLVIFGDTQSCVGKIVNISSANLPTVKYYFQNNNQHVDSSSNNINITQNGNYRLILKTLSTGCKDTSRTVPVVFNSKPIVSVLPKDTALYCAGSSVMLSANGSASNYQWKLNNQNIAGAITNTYQASQAGVYTVVNKTGQCADSVSLLAIEIPLPTKPNINTLGDTMTSTTTAAQYQWYLNGNAIAGANAQSYVGLQNGLYRVKVSNSFGCSDSSMDYTFTKSGIAEMGRDDIKLYPNPTSSYALLELATIATWQVQINDVSGKTLRTYKPFKGKELMIQKDELKAGAYLVQIKNMDTHKMATLKLIIE